MGPIQWGKIAARSQYALDYVGNRIYVDDGIDGIYPIFGPVVLARKRDYAG